MKILVADDDGILVSQLTGRLKSKGFDVAVAYDAMQATKEVQKGAPDAIVLDISMPGGTGHQVLKRLKNSPSSARIPVVVISANEDPDMEQIVRSEGANGFLGKPVDFDILYGALCRLLGRDAGMATA
jgi:two-component system, cell cycle response regulator